MIKKTVTYFDLDGKQRQQDVYFNLTRAEMLELGIEKGMDMGDWLVSVGNSGSNSEIFASFKELLGKAYGVRGDDSTFVKSKAATENFFASEVFSELIEWMFSNGEEAAKFMIEMFPKHLLDEKNDKGLTARQLAHQRISESPIANASSKPTHETVNDPELLIAHSQAPAQAQRESELAELAEYEAFLESQKEPEETPEQKKRREFEEWRANKSS